MRPTIAPVSTAVASLADRARGLLDRPGRTVLGITGPPGAGKSTLTSALLASLGPDVGHLPMDGFHLADVQLDQLGLRDRKGAPETFDVDGFVSALSRLASSARTLYVPGFERHLEQPIAAALAIPPSARLVITEGNYLLLPGDGWERVRPLLAEVWYVDLDDELRRERLISRHVQFGKSPDEAREWVLRSDEANARLVAATRAAADVVVDLARVRE
jgi:pantothenate kinase